MENVIGLILNFLMILIILMMILIVVVFIRANLKVNKSRHDSFKVNLTGKKVVQILLERWHIKGVKTRMLDNPKKEKASYSTYDWANRELILTPLVYQNKSVYAITIAIYESIRLKMLQEDSSLMNKYVWSKRWFWIILLVLVVLILNPVTLLTKQRYLWVDIFQVFFLLLVVGGYILYANKLELAIVNRFPEAFKELSVLKEEEQAQIYQTAHSYHYLMMAKPDKVIGYRKGGNRHEK